AMAAAASEQRQASAAVIVDQPAPTDGIPPLRLLRPVPQKAPAPVRVPLLVATPAARPSVKATQSSRPAPARARPVPVAKNAVRPPPSRTQRAAGPARPLDAPPDADVALISAVIVHANGHAPEGSQMTELLCPNNACQVRPTQP
ncbi:MAG: hypothetical protein ACREWI_18760, partial [Telluria sp.]